MSLQGPLDWLATLLGINAVQNAGASVPNSPGRRTLNLIGATIQDNPTNGSTDVTFPTASTTPVPGSTLSTSTTLTSPQNNATYLISTSTASVVITIAGTPADGVVLTFIDATQLWATHLFGFQPQAGAYVRNPENVAGADTTGQINVGAVAGESFSIKWFAGIGKWLPI